MNLIKKYLPTSIIILVVGILSAFLISAVIDGVMEKFGFETKETIRRELVDTQSELSRCRARGIELTNLIQYKEKMCYAREEAIKDLQEKDQDIDSQVDDSISKQVDIHKDETPSEPFTYDKGYESIYSLKKNLFKE